MSILRGLLFAVSRNPHHNNCFVPIVHCPGYYACAIATKTNINQLELVVSPPLSPPQQLTFLSFPPSSPSPSPGLQMIALTKEQCDKPETVDDDNDCSGDRDDDSEGGVASGGGEKVDLENTSPGSTRTRREHVEQRKRIFTNEKNKYKMKLRPGGMTKNSYLKLILDDLVLDELFRISQSIESAAKLVLLQHEMEEEELKAEKKSSAEKTASCVDESHEDEPAARGARENANKEARGSKDDKRDSHKRDLSVPKGFGTPEVTAASHPSPGAGKNRNKNIYKPMTRNYLHVTVYFGGEDISGLTTEQLVEWHGNITELSRGFQQRAVVGNRGSNNEHDDGKDMVKSTGAESAPPLSPEDTMKMTETCTLRFKGLKLFPPRRNNLIVAMFDAPSDLDQYRDDILSISLQEQTGLREMTKKSNLGKGKDEWKPHITLGRINVNKKRDKRLWKKAGDLLLQAGIEELESSRLANGVVCSNPTGGEHLESCVHGITMGGVIPDQTELDWDIRFNKRNK